MKVYFVGFGPGDPELLTLRGYRLLKEADLIIYPGSLIGEEFLSEFDAEKVNSYGMSLEQIADTIEDAIRAKKKVVRLQSGDPSVYGAIAEQMNALAMRGIECEVVPGVSSVFASAAALGAELTSLAPSVVITRPAGKTLEHDNLRELAALPCTLVVLLGIDKVDYVCEVVGAIRGMDEPAAVVYHASREDERVVRGTLEDIPEKVHKAGIERTATLIIGRSLEGFRRSVLYA
ncbi:cobalt-precorrin-4/precorrin-4 C(11)-methyltransferase [Methermicoccus shengliensis]|uniref:Cobalt-precorrin-4 C(11)-methyltransferase n=1 Tax=Methermicoccus shengliensis TaxID=660064 RepID=A0A832RYB1_9EURY|nr:SAM-dependent methyltransferase [Methermicoccus shengliensis]HIH69591.1 cobalt-precorrin-4 C(11)-methyltransferase [Methermicoccus shengliensis]